MDNFGDWSEALDFVANGASTPVCISDAGDNIRAGGSGDVTFAMHETRKDPRMATRRFLFAGLYDPAAFEQAVAAGVGATLEIAIGASIDDRFGSPVSGPWTVTGLVDGMYGEGVVGAILDDGHGLAAIVQPALAAFVGSDDPANPAFAWYGALQTDVSGY